MDTTAELISPGLPPITVNVFGAVHVHLPAHTDPAAITGPILAALAATKGQIMTDFHTELDAALASVVTQIDAVDADLARELADFAARVSPSLSDDERTQLASILQRTTALDVSINAADPAAPVVDAPATDGEQAAAGGSDTASADDSTDSSGDQSV